jgi:hypothetical protein
MPSMQPELNIFPNRIHYLPILQPQAKTLMSPFSIDFCREYEELQN